MAKRHYHGLYRTREYWSWKNALRRCYDPKNDHFQYYGARGITVCPRWRNSVRAFVDDMGLCPPGLQLDRIDNDGHYEPDNCRWATLSEQQSNKSSNVLVTMNGETKNLSAWARELGVDIRLLHDRIVRDGWPPERALTSSRRSRPKGDQCLLEWHGQLVPLYQLAKQYGLNAGQLRGRLRIGWTLERALSEPIHRST